MQQANHEIAYKSRATTLNLRVDALIQGYCVRAYARRLTTCESKAPMHSAGNVIHHNATMGVTTA
jgi:hypothetical protein